MRSAHRIHTYAEDVSNDHYVYKENYNLAPKYDPYTRGMNTLFYRFIMEDADNSAVIGKYYRIWNGSGYFFFLLGWVAVIASRL